MGAPEGGDVDLDRDRALVLRCQEGDGAAFAELYTQYHGRLHRFCMRRVCDRDEAEEIAQEAFLRAWRALPTFSGGLRFYPWLTVIAKNLCTDVLRKRARCGTVEDIDRQSVGALRLDPFSTTMSSEETVMATLDGELAAQALGRLSDRHRHVLRLREEHGLSYQEIATRQGVEVSTVETLLWRARQALKREYSALSGTRVLGGLLVGGAALRRLAERFGRRMARLAAVVRAGQRARGGRRRCHHRRPGQRERRAPERVVGDRSTHHPPDGGGPAMDRKHDHRDVDFDASGPTGDSGDTRQPL